MSKASKARKVKAKVQRKAIINAQRRLQRKRLSAQRGDNHSYPYPTHDDRTAGNYNNYRRPRSRRPLSDDEQYREDYRQWAEQRIRNTRRR